MIIKNLIPIIFILIHTKFISCNWFNETKKFNLSNESIDVIIACHEKDKDVLSLCINGIKKHVKNYRRIIILSEKQFSNEAEWFNEALFPFSKESISKEFSLIDPNFYKNPNQVKRVGWYFKQIMNFYAAFIVPEISNNILILDADTIFLRPVEFVDKDGNMLHVPGTEHYQAYFDHMNRLLPGLKKVYPKHSGISHHMLFQKPILIDLFNLVESHHKTEFWKVYCKCVEKKEIELSGSADYEIYFNFALIRCPKQIKIRQLRWRNISKISLLKKYIKEGYDFVSWHSYIRQDSIK